MAKDKPLPEVPSPPELSNEFRVHRSRILSNILGEAEDVIGNKEIWVYILEDVLDKLHAVVVGEDWLASIRRRRQAPPVEKDLKDEEADDNKGADVSKTPQASPEPELKVAFPSDTNKDESQRSLEHIRALVTKKTIGDAPLFLLCLTPYTGGPIPAEDSGFDIIPANNGCTFDVGKFVVEDGSIIYGQDQWQGACQIDKFNMQVTDIQDRRF